MKYLIILATLLILTNQVIADETNNNNYNKQPAQRTQQVQQTQNTKPVATQTQTKDSSTYSADYLLKYNIDDLEAAPWLNGGKRKI